ncbi:hypothetical protein BJV82DRAFT_684376 [Fennellomyces sp. T-0311]|nr:hypothetical protein BJV82DRAFT_684376 [Fennellomyces sp. T-0311]
MSIEPEVPYDVDLDTIEKEENWRDHQIIGHYSVNEQPYNERSQIQVPDDSWLSTTDFILEEVLGKGRCKLEEIRRDTNTSLKLNEPLRQLDIWGDRESVKRARRMLDLIMERLQQQRDASMPKSRKWSKPERELTKAEQKRADPKLAKHTEDLTYREYPDVPFQYTGFMPFPDRSLHPTRVVGAQDEYLNRLRAECKCYMRFNDAHNMIELTHKKEENVVKAGKRMRNWYLQVFRTPKVSLIHLLKQPNHIMVVQFCTLPPHFFTYHYAPPGEEQAMQGKGSLLEGLTTGAVVGQIDDQLGLITLDNPQDDVGNELSDTVKNLDAANIKAMESALEAGLESLRLTQWEMKMKVRFGHIVLTQYPRQNIARSLDYFVGKVLPHKNFEANFAPCVGKTEDDLRDVFDWLSWSRVKQKRPLGEEQWETTLIVKFTGEKRVGTWRCLTQSFDVTTIRSADLQNDYDWELKLQRAVHTTKGEIRGTPHGLFADGLALNTDTNRLIFHLKSRCYTPRLVTQKKEWVYAYNGDWSIELTQDEIWDVSRLNITRDRHDLPLDLSAYKPRRVIYKLALYREQWVIRFAENLLVELGEAPSWLPATFLRNPKDKEDTLEAIINVAQEVKKILNKKCLL